MTKEDVKRIIDKCLGVNCIVEKHEYNFRDDFYTPNDTIYEEDDDFHANVEFPQEYIDAEVKEEIQNTPEKLQQIIKEAYEQYQEEIDEIRNSKQLTRKEKAKELKKLREEIWNRINEEIEEWKFEIKDDILQKLYEGLDYWTVYFQPDIEDIEAAIECGLIPFYYNGEFYLALGGCGMDLSPKLDAYQALTDGTVPPNSKLLYDHQYTDYVVGKETRKKAIKAAKKDKAEFVVTFDDPE